MRSGDGGRRWGKQRRGLRICQRILGSIVSMRFRSINQNSSSPPPAAASRFINGDMFIIIV